MAHYSYNLSHCSVYFVTRDYSEQTQARPQNVWLFVQVFIICLQSVLIYVMLSL